MENYSKKRADEMVKYNPKQITIRDFKTPFGRGLNPQNRWVRLAEIIPWNQLHETYASTLCKDFGRPAKDSRLILGSIIVKHKKHLTDEELIEEIQENIYIQYFLGYEGFSHQKPFDASLLVTIRKRLGKEVFDSLNQQLMDRIREIEREHPPEPRAKKKRRRKTDPPGSSEAGFLDEGGSHEPPNQGQLLLDAFVAPQDIKFPTDLDLLNDAREHAERLIDQLYVPEPGKIKPRTHRNKARRDYLLLAKKKRKTLSELRSGIRKQLNYLRRDIGHIKDLLDPQPGKPVALSPRDLRLFWIIQELYRQQREMHQKRKHSIPDRIVNLLQPHVRPIVRGKTAHPVEFGAKISGALVNGYAYLDRICWDAYNENQDLIGQIERYKERFGFYPTDVIVDDIYGTRENRRYARSKGIRLSCKPLGRPRTMNEEERKAFWKQRRQDTGLRNQIEGKFGEGKRKYGLDKIMAKTASTSESWISAIFFVMNIARWERVFFVPFWNWLKKIVNRLFQVVKEQRMPVFTG
jgi:IS5 family transposase